MKQQHGEPRRLGFSRKKLGNAIAVSFTKDTSNPTGVPLLDRLVALDLVGLTSLIEKGGQDVDARDMVTGETALHIAVRIGWPAIVKLLLQSGASVNVRDNQGHTPMHVVVQYGYRDIMALLLRNRADYLLVVNDDSGNQTSKDEMEVLPFEAGQKAVPRSSPRLITRNQSLFYDVLLSPVHIKKNAIDWIHRLVEEVADVFQCQIFFTVVSAAQAFGLISKIDAKVWTSDAIIASIFTCRTQQVHQLMNRIIQYAKERNLVNERALGIVEAFGLSTYPEDNGWHFDPQSLLDSVNLNMSKSRTMSWDTARAALQCASSCLCLPRPTDSLVMAKGVIHLMDAVITAMILERKEIPEIQTLCFSIVNFFDVSTVINMLDAPSWRSTVIHGFKKGQEFALRRMKNVFIMDDGFMDAPTFVANSPLRGAYLLGICNGFVEGARRSRETSLSLLHQECERDDICLETISKFVRDSPGMVGLVDTEGCLPIHRLCKHSGRGNMSFLRIARAAQLLTKGQYDWTLRSKDNKGRMPLHMACLARPPKSSLIRLLVQRFHGALHSRDEYGFLPFHLACMQKNLTRDVLELLLPLPFARSRAPALFGSGNPLNEHPDTMIIDLSSDDFSTTAESILSTSTAAHTQRLEGGDSVSYNTELGTNGSTFKFTKGSSYTTEKQTNLTSISHEIARPPPEYFYTVEGDNPIRLAVRHGLSSPVLRFLDDSFPELVFDDLHLRIADEDDCPLHAMIKYNDRTGLKFLLFNDADVGQVDSKGRSVLDYAAFMGHEDFFERLYERGAKSALFPSRKVLRGILLVRAEMRIDPGAPTEKDFANLAGNEGFPIHIAIVDNDDVEFHRLMEQDRLECEFDTPDPQGYSPVDLAVVLGRQGFLDTLLAKGARPGKTHSAVVLHRMVSWSKGASDRRDHSSQSSGSSQRSRRRRSSVSDYSSQRSESARTTSSRSATSDSMRRVTSALKVFGDAILSREDEAIYPLHRAIKYGDIESLQRALAATSMNDLNQVDSEGRSPLDLAGLSGQRNIFNILRNHGAQSVKVSQFILEIQMDQIREPNVRDYHSLIRSHPPLLIS